LKALSNNNKRA